MPSTSQAAPVWDPANRDARPSRLGSLRSRISAKVISPARTSTANKSSRNPSANECPIPGIANPRENRSPYASMIVKIKMMKPQNVTK